MQSHVVIRLILEHVPLDRQSLRQLSTTSKKIHLECQVKLNWYRWMRRKAKCELYFLNAASKMYCVSSGEHTFATQCSRVGTQSYFLNPFWGNEKNRTVKNAMINLETICKFEGTWYCSCKHIKKKDRPVIEGSRYVDDPNERLEMQRDHQNQHSEYGWFSMTYSFLNLAPISHWMTGYVPDHTISGDHYKHFLKLGVRPNRECDCDECREKSW